jgi:hypothetical protein
MDAWRNGGGMARDVELMRLLLLELEREQRSPPEAFFVPVEEFARRLDRSNDEIVAALDLLRELAFIEGPGRYRDDSWLFRKLTRRGEQLAAAIGDLRDWLRVKESYTGLLER